MCASAGAGGIGSANTNFISKNMQQVFKWYSKTELQQRLLDMKTRKYQKLFPELETDIFNKEDFNTSFVNIDAINKAMKDAKESYEKCTRFVLELPVDATEKDKKKVEDAVKMEYLKRQDEAIEMAKAQRELKELLKQQQQQQKQQQGEEVSCKD